MTPQRSETTLKLGKNKALESHEEHRMAKKKVILKAIINSEKDGKMEPGLQETVEELDTLIQDSYVNDNPVYANSMEFVSLTSTQSFLWEISVILRALHIKTLVN